MKGINTTRVKPTPIGHEKCYVLISTVNTNGSSRGISLFFNFVLEGRRMQILIFDKAHLKSEPLGIISQASARRQRDISSFGNVQ